jgi:hypothetical protein
VIRLQPLALAAERAEAYAGTVSSACSGNPAPRNVVLARPPEAMLPP